MVTAQKIEQAVSGVKDRTSLLQGLLADTLHWPIPEDVEQLDDLGYGWTEEDLHAQGLERHLLEGQIWQLPLRHGQPWGIFVVEFAHDKVYRTVLRQVLRGLVPSRRRPHNLPAWDHPRPAFPLRHSRLRADHLCPFPWGQAQTARLMTFGWQTGDHHLRTVCEFNLPPLVWPEDDGHDPEGWFKQWAKGFDKEPLTKDFFRRFDSAIAAIKGDLEKLQDSACAEAYSRGPTPSGTHDLSLLPSEPGLAGPEAGLPAQSFPGASRAAGGFLLLQ